tara:strand:- start:100 stop:1671 length:1572 start_codon:yes stop_codon:yes gene_type:complete
MLTPTISLTEENDTAFTTNILPNAGDTTSSLSNANLDGVQSGSTGALTNNSTHNGFTITCDTQVSSACGRAFNGELEASHDMTVTATGSLVGISGISTPDGLSHTSTQQKLNGGINLESSVSVQNCEWSGSSYQCGDSVGVVDSYTITMKVKNSDGDVLASSTQIRTNDTGYNANAGTFDDSLHYNGVHANTYEWSWKGVDGSESTSVITRGPNLLGAELKLDFPTDDYEPLSTTEIKEFNDALGTTNLNESEIWNIVSGLEESISEKLNIEAKGAVVMVELTENFEVIIYTAKGASVEEVAKVQEVVQTMNETKAIETIKKEVIQEVMEEMNEEPQSTQTTSLPMVSEEEKVSSKKEEETKVIKTPPGMILTKNEEKKEETKEEESTSETSTTTTVSTKKITKQKTLQKKKNINAKLEKLMTKVDEKIKDSAKNLEIKNLIKLDVMLNEQVSLAMYETVEFYLPKAIYEDQLDIFDDRQLYPNTNLANYTVNDPVFVKEQQLKHLDNVKQRLLFELEQLKNG